MSLLKRKDRDWTLDELAKEKEKYERQMVLYEKEKEIYELKQSMRRWKPPTTTKLLMTFIFLNCTVVEVYSMVAMWVMMDLSPLYSLITAVVTESLSFAVYAAKAYNETKQEELIKLQREQIMLDHSSPSEDGMDESCDPEAAETEETDD